MIRETFRKMASKLFRRHTSMPPAVANTMAVNAPPSVRVRKSANYNVIPGSGPGESARRRRAMQRRVGL